MNKPESIKSILTGRSSLENWVSDKYPEFREYLNNKYQDIPIKEQIYLYYNNMLGIPTCPICGKKVKFHGNKYGYAKYCSPTCAQIDEKTQEKQKQTKIEKYGIDYGNIIIEKTKQTKIEKYGDEKYNNINKLKQTCLERYGVDNPMKSKIFQEKSKQTCLKRYGVEYNLLLIDHKTSGKNRMLNNDPDIINWDKDNNTLTCKCPDNSCSKCKEKQYLTTYYSYYERKNIYNICPCTIKIPPYTCSTYKNTNIEIIIKDILDEYDINYIQNDKSVLSTLELDFYIPDKRLAIECNGIYWHSSKFRDNKFHYNKMKACEERGIQLLTIWEDQVLKKPDIIKSIILSKLSIYENRIYARKCEIKEVNSKDSKDFLMKNHLQGSVNSSVKLGLYYNNKLVSLMTFGKKRSALGNKNTEGWELYRFCNKLNIQVIGGASKLFKYFINNYHVNKIESFSSNDISNGLLYNKLGFKMISETFSYWYVKNKKRYHRYKFRKSELIKMGFDKNKTEFQIMEDNGYHRIYDTGQKKWIYKI